LKEKEGEEDQKRDSRIRLRNYMKVAGVGVGDVKNRDK